MVAAAALLFAVNGAVAKVVLLGTDISSQRLAEIRSWGALAGFGLLAVVASPRSLRVRARELPSLAAFGIFGLALVQWSYFLAIEKLEIGVALVIQFQAPLLVALWVRLVVKEPVRRRIWVALTLAVPGLVLVVRVWDGLALSTVGLAAAVISAVTYAIYVLLAERALERRDAVSLSCWGFVFAALFWTVLEPWWTFRAGVVGETVSLRGNLTAVDLPVWLLLASVVVLGSVVPFALVVGALRHLPATRVAIAAMLEPVAATLVAYLWLDEALTPLQLVGGALVVAAVAIAQSARA